jgi:hypothetical protein
MAIAIVIYSADSRVEDSVQPPSKMLSIWTIPGAVCRAKALAFHSGEKHTSLRHTDNKPHDERIPKAIEHNQLQGMSGFGTNSQEILGGLQLQAKTMKISLTILQPTLLIIPPAPCIKPSSLQSLALISRLSPRVCACR